MAYPYYPYTWNNGVQPYQPTQAPVQAANEITWVQGETDAKARPVIAGHSALFMDSETTTFYIKTVDNSGIPQPLRTFDYKERTQTTPTEAKAERQINNTVTREEFDALVKKVDGMLKGEGEG